MSQRRVAVIGAGPAGLTTLRNFASFLDEFELVAFDKNRDVGGLWNYSDETDIDEYGLPCYSNMYKTLRSNLPLPLMAFPGFDYPPALPSFCGHKVIKKYLSDFADHFDVRKFVKFQTYVTKVEPETSDDTSIIWNVTTRDLVTDDVRTTKFDVVVVCNGREGLPFCPTIPGEKVFRGDILHSKSFRDPQKYEGQVVMVVGAFLAGCDLIFELSPHVRKLYISHRKDPLQFKLPSNAEEVPCIQEVTPDGVVLQNGRHVDVGVIIYATGYHYNLPFLTPECGVTCDGDRVQPVYRHTINIRHPTLCFVGLLKHVLEFHVIHRQATYIVASLRGTFKLPSEQDMLADEEADHKRRVADEHFPESYTHDLFHPTMGNDPQWEYIAKISREAKLSDYPPAIIKLTKRVVELHLNEYGTFRDRNFHLVGNDDFEEVLLQDK